MTRRTRSSAVPLESRLEFETLLADLSSRFINLPPGEVDREIEDALRRVCELLGIDLAVLWQWSTAAPDVIAPTHAYPPQEDLQPPRAAAPGAVPLVPCGRCWPAARSPSLRWTSCRRRPPSTASPPAVPASSRTCACRSRWGGEAPVGALALNTLRAEREWPDALVKRLQLVAQVFTNALARRRTDQALRESEERLSLAADSAEAGLWTLDYGTGAFWATDRARAIFGYSPDDVINMERFEASVHPDDWDSRSGRHRPVRAQAGEPIDVEYRIIRPGDGGVRWIASRGQPAVAPHRRAGAPDGRLHRRHRAQARRGGASQRARRRLAAGADLAGLGVLRGGLRRGRHVRRRPVSRRLRHSPGPGARASRPLRVLDGAPPSRRPRARSGPARAVARRAGWSGSPSSTATCTRPRGEVDPPPGARRRARRRRTRGQSRSASSATSRERKRTEDELRDLSRRLIRAHEEERALLARELHDDVTQRLAVLAIDVGRAELAAPDGAQAEAMRSVREGLVRLSEDIHSLAYQLHPSVLEELGLAEALRAECERRGRRGGSTSRLELDPLPAAFGQGRGALPVPRGAGGAEQRRPPRRRARRERHAAADGRRAAPRRPRRRRRLRSGESEERAGASAWRACANVCGW